VYNIKRAVN